MSTKFKGQGKWVREILIKFTELEKDEPKPFNLDPTWPEWVTNLVTMQMGIAYPGVKFKSIKKWKARDLGRLLGRQYAGEHLRMGVVPVSAKAIQEAEKFSGWMETRAKSLNPSIDMPKLEKEFEQGMKEWTPKFKRFIQDVLVSVCERPYGESSAFFEAFGKAIVMKPDSFETERTMGVGDKIAWAMVFMWPEINQLESVAQLHRVLEQALKPRGIKVKYKRIEKLCQRIKLKFKGPGRPSGTKTQTNPTSV